MDAQTHSPDSLLTDLIGQWHGIARTWFDPATVVDESPIQGTFRQIGESRFVLYEYDGTFEGNPLHGAAIYGYNQWTQRFEGVWVDSFHMTTNIMVSTGILGDSQLNVQGTYLVEGSLPWGWRTTIVVEHADRLTLTCYNRAPDGPETRAIEIQYHRV